MDEDIGLLADPSHPGEAVQIANEMRSKGDLDGSERVLRWAMDFNPTHPGLLAGLSSVASRRGDASATVDWLKIAIRHNPGDMSPRLQLTDFYLDHHNLDAAEGVLEAAHAIAPYNSNILVRLSALAARRSDLPSALAFAEQAIEAQPEAWTYHHLIGMHLQAYDTAAAEEWTIAGLQLNPDDPTLICRLSEIAMRRGDMPLAFAHVEKAIALAPQDGHNHNHLAELHMRQGAWEAAYAACQAALAARPGDTGLIRRLSEIATRRGDIAANPTL